MIKVIWEKNVSVSKQSSVRQKTDGSVLVLLSFLDLLHSHHLNTFKMQHCTKLSNALTTDWLFSSHLFVGLLLEDKEISFYSQCRYSITMYQFVIPQYKISHFFFWKLHIEILLLFCIMLLFSPYRSFLGSWHFHSLESFHSRRGDQTTILIDLSTTPNPFIHVPLSPDMSYWSWQSACWGEQQPWWHCRRHTGRSRCSRWTYGRTLAPLRSLQRARILTRKEFWNSPPHCKEPERKDESKSTALVTHAYPLIYICFRSLKDMKHYPAAYFNLLNPVLTSALNES